MVWQTNARANMMRSPPSKDGGAGTEAQTQARSIYEATPPRWVGFNLSYPRTQA